MPDFEIDNSDEQSDTRDTQLTKMYEYVTRNKKGPEGPFLFNIKILKYYHLPAGQADCIIFVFAAIMQPHILQRLTRG